jgi:SAM-dependent methyltransferase
LARQLLKTVPAGRFLEIGVGSGAFYQDLQRKGFTGTCLDLNKILVQTHCRQKGRTESVIFQAGDFFLLREQFDLIVAFEVLEHYEDDALCLRKWEDLLKQGGTLIFSVPAHMRQWTRNDTQAGHARRYEKAELLGKLSTTRLQLDHLWCYGFPILNLTYPLSSIFGKRREESPEEALLVDGSGNLPMQSEQTARSGEMAKTYATDFTKTLQSGYSKLPQASKWLFQEWLWMPFLQLQKVFLRRDSGIGYVVSCRRV